MKRRSFLAASAAGLTVGFFSGCTFPVIPKRPAPSLDDAMGWIRHHGGGFTLFLARAEIGQHIGTALRQIACEELGVESDAVRLQLPSTDDVARVRATVGSESIKAFALPLAQACATLREALARGETQGTLAPRAVPIAELRSLGPGSARRHVGRSVPTAFGREIVTGAPLFASDVRLPGLLYGRVLRAEVSPELLSEPIAFDEVAARAVPGFVAIVHDELLRHAGSTGVGIVARTPGALDRIAVALGLQWRVDGQFGQADIDARLDIDRRLGDGALRHTPKSDAIERDAPWTVDLRLDVPLAAHAPIEPRCAVASYRAAPDGAMLELWAGTQDLFYQRDVLAKRLGLDERRVRVQAHRVGGAFGGKTLPTVELEAAVLSRAVSAPVKLQWTRAQEFTLGFHRPPSSHRIRARVKDGRLTDWWHAFASSHILFTSAALPPWMQRFTDFIGDDGVARGSQLPYEVPRQRIEFDVLRLPVHTGPWRGLGAGPNALAMESTIDECARASGTDALAFRLAHLGDTRLVRALKAVARDAGWPGRPPSDAAMLRGRGIAGGVYKGMSVAAAIADVAVNRASGAVRVTRLWCAHDCGRVVHPDVVRAQVEGNLVWCLGMVLVERLPVADSGVAAATFADSPIPRIGDVPTIAVTLIDDGDAPGGAGETAMVAGAAAIANALRDAVGVRFSRMPVRAADVLEALASQRGTL
ncbi:xanthine dehydrogenase family protein molybdopterin-binding subunit [Piscinibacter sp.]|uniref:xanthine dehydrogenase family protein molybdopterin-binding subunit n=1 Tax=Piscinibacter sp. TaxID=1903157 RepID=UPI002B6B2E50|nr:molybdopterin cofactor-binding domain-containing protein [Albitalea sp.]HUG24557.1 molybdopterin cofactor-binding domain-containing protein [Albitalea sp.]